MPLPREVEDLVLLLSLVHGAWTEGRLTQEELRLIRSELAEQGLDPAEVARVRELFGEPPAPDSLRPRAASPAARLSPAGEAWALVLPSPEPSPGPGAEARREARAFVADRVVGGRERDWRGSLLADPAEELA